MLNNLQSDFVYLAKAHLHNKRHVPDHLKVGQTTMHKYRKPLENSRIHLIF